MLAQTLNSHGRLSMRNNRRVIGACTVHSYHQTLQSVVFATPGLFDIAAKTAYHSIILDILDAGNNPADMEKLIS